MGAHFPTFSDIFRLKKERPPSPRHGVSPYSTKTRRAGRGRRACTWGAVRVCPVPSALGKTCRKVPGASSTSCHTSSPPPPCRASSAASRLRRVTRPPCHSAGGRACLPLRRAALRGLLSGLPARPLPQCGHRPPRPVMTPRLKAGACVWTPPQLRVPFQALSFGFSIRHIGGA